MSPPCLTLTVRAAGPAATPTGCRAPAPAGPPAGPLRPAASRQPGISARHRGQVRGSVALPRAAAGPPGRPRGGPRRGDDAAAPHAGDRPGARGAEPADEGGGSPAHRHVQGAWRRGRRIQGRRARRGRDRHADQRQRRGRLVGLRRQGGDVEPYRDARRRPADHPRRMRGGRRRAVPGRRRDRGRRGWSPMSCNGAPATRTPPRSGSPTGSRARRRWAWRSPSSLAGGCPCCRCLARFRPYPSRPRCDGNRPAECWLQPAPARHTGEGAPL